MILANRRIAVREVAEDLNISIGTCHSIFINDLGMRRVAAKFVPKLLNCGQKQHRINIANEMLDSVGDDPNLLQRVITGDEARVYGYDVETKAQSSQWKLPHEPRPKKARQVRSNVKVLLTVFFDCRGVVHHEFLPQGRTVNKEYYLQVMRNLREAIRQKRPNMWKNKNWLLHNDNAPAHTSLLVRDLLAKNNTLMMPQPPYSPDLAPCDFFLFPKLKRPMKGRRYATLDKIKTASKEELKKILKNDFLKCYEDWKNRWHKCIISHGDYFEGDKIVVVDGKTTVPIISAGKGKLRVRKNQCVGRVELLNLDDVVVNLDVAEDSFQTKNEEKREGQDQMKRKRPILPEDINVNHSLTSKERQEILDVVNEYRDCFALGMEELGCTDVTKMDIKEVDGSKPVCLRPYKTTASEREAIREIVRERKDNGIVTETRSPYASPVLLVRKKTGDHRLVVDYRRLNIQTVKDKFPLPRIDDLLEGLRNAKFFTTLDLAHGYLQIPLTDKAKLKTAFITPDDTGQFESMIFGLANAPAEFQRLMHTVLGPLLNKKAFCYLDDVIIPAKDWREMIERLREVLERIRSAKLTLKPSKCEFGRREVEFLGYVISTGGLKPGPRKIKAIEEFPEPKNVHDIRRFLGLTNFFRRFVKDFARKAEPLSRLTKKGSQFEWKEEQRRSFGGLRKDLVEYPVLAHYNPELKTEVHCDASAEGLAGILLQMDEDGKWRLVYCVSKKTTEAENMYHSSKLELMAIVWTLDRLRQFLVGIKFTVVTDCQALVYMNAKKTTNPQIARWYNLIQEYDFEIRHKPGEKMAHVDGMSRAPVDDPRDTMEEIVEKNLEVCFAITLEEQIFMIQHSDPELRDLIQIFRKDPCDRTVGEQNRINDYSYKGGRLFRMVKNGEEERALYVIPKSMRKSLVVKFHDLMGHFATDRTVNKIKELYWFPSMKRYVRRHVAMCLECLFNKVPGGKQQGFLHPIKSGKRPFSIVHMDHVGPFVRSTKGNQELLVIVDNLTRFVRLNPVRNTSTQNVLKVMKSFVNDFGLPDKIISDRGEGMVERVNRTVLSTIATSIEDPRRKDWDLKIKEVERDLNNAVNKTTNKTPFETLHGYSPRFHDGILRRLADEDVDPWTEPDRIQESVRTQIENKQKIMKTYYDKKKCRTIQFEVGEIVVMRHVPKMTGEPTKAQPKYRGPLIITEVLPSDTYRVTQLSERTSGRFYTTTAHISQLKSWHSEEDDSATEESPDEEPEVEDTPRRNPRRSCNARFNRGRLKSRNGRM
ncbi:hypothetical protein LAZ67_16001984 [Cordylochernes scorpioides]|uniref:RNA-directed DNA polymerase n=1 Tax=Cordylochernes scorpioides TaxID=51811 RepID=A0ABY6LF72_9ARAC|nr:hypothetical protein LAZ67_16001984 [Cordylochernes scorpioides]